MKKFWRCFCYTRNKELCHRVKARRRNDRSEMHSESHLLHVLLFTTCV